MADQNPIPPITAGKLQELSLRILNAHKGGDHGELSALFAAVFPGEPEVPGRPAFLKLIKELHPDRLLHLNRRLEAAAASADSAEMARFRTILSLKDTAPVRRPRPVDIPEGWSREEYQWGGEDWADDEETFDAGEEPWAKEEVRGGYDFISALSSQQLGNWEVVLLPGDLASLEGELDLSSYGISDLTGLEHCLNLTILDLSWNSLDNIHEIRFLGYLRELYLAHNEISDLGPLEGLESLELLDLQDNDIEDFTPLLQMTGLQLVYLGKNPGGRSKDTSRVLEILKTRGVLTIS